MRATADSLAHRPHDAPPRRAPAPLEPQTHGPQEVAAAAGAKSIAAAALPRTISAPSTPTELLRHTAATGQVSVEVLRRLLHLELRREQNPELRTIQIVGASGVYAVSDEPQGKPAKSIGIYNPTTYEIWVGIGGNGASAAALAPSVPGGCGLVLPVQADQIQLGTTAAILAENTAVFFLFRYATLQPLSAFSLG